MLELIMDPFKYFTSPAAINSGGFIDTNNKLKKKNPSQNKRVVLVGKAVKYMNNSGSGDQ